MFLEQNYHISHLSKINLKNDLLSYFVLVTNRAFMFLKMSLGAERHCTRLTAEWPFKVMNVDMKTELAWLGEDFITDDTDATPIVCHAETDDNRC